MIPEMAFGQTGHVSTRTIFGAAALGKVNQDDADRTLEVLLRYGINHIDTAAAYGESELRIGPWMGEHRQRFFLATKTGERTYQGAHDQIRRSLERLRVPQVDLLQLHQLTDPQEWETAMGPDGALKAAIEARDEGLTRFIGVTGHGVTAPAMHLRSLARFPFDAVLLPCNYPMLQNPQYAAGFNALIAECQKRGIPVQTIKSICRGPLGDKPKAHTTWYDPLTEPASIERAVHWLLGRPVFLNTASDIHILPTILEAASRYQTSPSDEQMQDIVSREGMAPLFT
jgi:aryl-alcohol dehydrogenase-like predicted oxidoreductase